MNDKDSFDSEKSDFSDCDSEKFETRERTTKGDKEDEFGEEESCQIKNLELIKSISQVLETILNDNKHLEDYKDIIKKQRKLVFSSRTIPAISIEDYLIRMQNYANIEKNTLIVGLIYIDRLCQISEITLTYYNIHRILFTSILLSIKYNEDKYYDNKYYADIAGVSKKELNCLEINFAKMIQFNLYVNDETFKNYKLYLDNMQ